MSKKIAFFSIATHLGGAERSLLEFLSNYKEKNSNILVVVPKQDGPLIDELKKLNIKVQKINLQSWALSLSRNRPIELLFKSPLLPLALLQYLKQINDLVKNEKIDCIHSTGLKNHIFLGLFSKWINAKVKIVIHLRDIIHQGWIRRFFNKISNSKNITFVSNSKVTADSVAPLKTEIIYNGFDTHLFQKTKGVLRVQLNIPSGAFIVGIVGAIARWKGQREFINSAKDVLTKNNQIHFVVIGDEIYDTHAETGEKQLLLDQVQKENLQGNIHFLGFQKNLPPIYSDIDVLVHASIKPEPFGRVIVEAMLCECAVTASKSGGPLEIIEDRKSGLLHPPKDSQAMAQNILWYYNNPEKKALISKNARLACQRFSMKNYVEKLSQNLEL